MVNIFLAFVVLLLIGCVNARDPQLMALGRSGDASLTCEQIATEYKSNTEVARSKIEKNHSDDTKQLLLALFVWPGFLDLKNADGNEGNALLERNIYLTGIANAKSCSAINSWPEQPKRYM